MDYLSFDTLWSQFTFGLDMVRYYLSKPLTLLLLMGSFFFFWWLVSPKR